MQSWEIIVPIMSILIGSGGAAALWQARAASIRVYGQNQNDLETRINQRIKDLDDAQSRFQERLQKELSELRDENAVLRGRVTELSQTLSAVIAERDTLKVEVFVLRNRLETVEGNMP
jgi:chromosome segregation ATPase